MSKKPTPIYSAKLMAEDTTFGRRAPSLQETRLTPEGREIPDPTPVAPPVGYKKQPSMMENVREMIRSERLRQEAEAAGMESFEEADDFEIDDDPADPESPYEKYFDPQTGEPYAHPTPPEGYAYTPEGELVREADQPSTTKNSSTEKPSAAIAPGADPSREPGSAKP